MMNNALTFNAERFRALEQKCMAFVETIRATCKESSKVGNGMKSKYNNLVVSVKNFVEILPDLRDFSDGQSILVSFPMRLCSSTLLEGTKYVINRSKALVCINIAIQHLFAIIECIYLYVRFGDATDAGTFISPSQEEIILELSKGDFYKTIEELLLIFEIVARLEKVDEFVRLRTTQTVLQFFSRNSPILCFSEIITRSFDLLGLFYSVKTSFTKQVLSGAILQLVLSVVGTSVVGISQNCCNRSPPPTSLRNESIILEVCRSSCDVLHDYQSKFMINLDVETAVGLLQIVLSHLPSGSFISCKSLRELLKDQIFETLKFILTKDDYIHYGCLILPNIFSNHVYFWENHRICFGQNVESFSDFVLEYESLISVRTLYSLDNSNSNLHRKIVWLQCFLDLLQSKEVWLAFMGQESTKELWFSITQFVCDELNSLRVNLENGEECEQIEIILDSFYDGLYLPCDYVIISEKCVKSKKGDKCDLAQVFSQLPLFSIKKSVNFHRTDTCNFTLGIWNSDPHRYTSGDYMDPVKLKSAIAGCEIDFLLLLVSSIYSSVLSCSRDSVFFSPYKILFSEDANMIHVQYSNKRNIGDPILYKMIDCILTGLEYTLKVFNNTEIEVAILTTLQNLMVICKLRSLNDLYHKSLRLITRRRTWITQMCSYDNHKEVSIKEFNSFILSVRCLNSVCLIFAPHMEPEDWQTVMDYMISSMWLLNTLGISCNNENSSSLKTFSSITELSSVIKRYSGLESQLSGLLAEIDRLLNHELLSHDPNVIENFFVILGFQLFLPLLRRRFFNGISVERHDECDSIIHFAEFVQKNWKTIFLDYIQLLQSESGNIEDCEWIKTLKRGALTTELLPCVLNDANAEFLFGVYIEISEKLLILRHANELLMLFNAIIVSVTRSKHILERIVGMTCSVVNLIHLSGEKFDDSTSLIDIGLCILYKLLKDPDIPDTIEIVVLTGIKGLVAASPWLLGKCRLVLICLSLSIVNYIGKASLGFIRLLVEIFALLVENALEFLEAGHSTIMFADCLFRLANGSLSSDKNLAFRVIGLVLDFVDVMAHSSSLFSKSSDSNQIKTSGEVRSSKDDEIMMWETIFQGLKSLSLCENSEIRHCAIKSLALFVKGHMNHFNINLWQLCCNISLKPLAKCLAENLSMKNHEKLGSYRQTVLIACEEICIAFKECRDSAMRICCESVVSELLDGLKLAITSMLMGCVGNRDPVLINELNASVRTAVNILTDVTIEHFNCESIWCKYLEILERISLSGSDVAKQNLYKSICSIMVSTECDDINDKKIEHLIKVFLHDNCENNGDNNELIDSIYESMAIPPWLFLDPNYGESDFLSHLDALNKLVLTSYGEERVNLQDFKLKNVKIKLRSKIANSVGILPEMQMIQLVTLHYVPQILAQTDVMEKISAANIVDGVKSYSNNFSDEFNHVGTMKRGETVLGNVADETIKKKIVDNVMTQLKEQDLFCLVENFYSISRLFCCLANIKNSRTFIQLSEALLSKFLDNSEEERLIVSLQFVDKLTYSIREHVSRFMLASKQSVDVFCISKEYKLFVQAVVPLIPRIFDCIRRFIIANPLKQVFILLYQSFLNIAKYVYLGLYFCVHFCGCDLPNKLCAEYWSSTVKILDFFTLYHHKDIDDHARGSDHMDDADCTDDIFRHVTLLHAISIDWIASLIVSPFSIASPFVYGAFAQIFDRFVVGESFVLRRISLQRLSDAASYPFLALSPVSMKSQSQESQFSTIRLRIHLTKNAVFVLANRLKQFLEKHSDVEAVAALQIAESIVTLPGEILFDEDDIRKHKFMRCADRKPLICLLLKQLFEGLDSSNKKISRTCKRLLGVYLQDIGVKITI